MDSVENFPLWQNALSVSMAITEETKSGRISREALILYLDTLNETFKASADPLTDFHGFVFAELCKSIRDSLEVL